MVEAPDTTDADKPSSPHRYLRFGLIAAGVLLFALLAREAGAYVPRFAAWVDSLGFWGPVVFVLGYAVAVVALVPASALTLGAGAVFGLAWGTLYVFVAAVAGATAALFVARYLARDWIEKKIGHDPRFRAIDRSVGEQGRKIVFLLRLTPAVPFGLLNYALGLTRVRVVDTLVAAVGMLPGTLLYVYSGKVAGDVAAAASGAAESSGPAQLALLAVGLLATIAVTVTVTRIARRALAEATESTELQ
ncbi:MAG: TVP38/TMEM64 family protein [Myxococcales bacterium]|nr:TVP38/TMEM64 family protein [Myxococcales bacterium]